MALLRIHRHMFALLGVLVFSCLATSAEIPKVVQKDGRYALLVDGQPYLMLGAQIHNSSAWPRMLPQVWDAVKFISANTVEAPIYWEQLEPKPGQFDFTNVDTLVRQARENNVRLVLLWFGTWKNGAMHYTPEWIKTDTVRYPRIINANGQKMDILSAHSQPNLDADSKAFSALMRHLKEIDGNQYTVIMVQVENEAGHYGTVRDFSPAAQELFDSAVPAELVTALRKQRGTWKQVFGADADESFAAYSIAHYIDQVAAAGKAEYALPMYVNVALRDPEDANARPGANYPSGGPTHNVLDLWIQTAKHIDAIGPDIYLNGDKKYGKVLSLYARADNPLFVPETSNAPANAKYLFSALGLGAIGFAPFGVDRTGYSNAPLGADTTDKTMLPFADNYRLLKPFAREIAELNFEGKLKTAVEEKGTPRKSIDFGKWQVMVSYGLPQFGFGTNPPGNPDAEGRALVAQLSADEFLVTGFDARVDFELAPSITEKKMQYIRVEEGVYENGDWKFLRIWNGDQTDWGLNFKSSPQVLRVKLGTY